MQSIKLELDLKGQFCNHWPLVLICVNNQKLFDGTVEDSVNLNFDINAGDTNVLSVQHYGKSFGDSGIYDCVADQSQDCVLIIKDIRFQGVTVGQELMSKLFFETAWTPAQLESLSADYLSQMSRISAVSGQMNFNSQLILQFETPVLNWLTMAKYKIEAKNTAYFSSYSLRWHYKEDLKIIKEIKQLMQ